MAQQVVIAGAMFEDVPQISVPDANNVYHPFLDTTIASNAAAASDITQGKLAYVNGSLVTGTNQGGGGGESWSWMGKNPTLVHAFAPEHVLFKDSPLASWTWSTSSSTLQAEQSFEQLTVDNTHDYVFLVRFYAHYEYDNWDRKAAPSDFATVGYSFVFRQATDLANVQAETKNNIQSQNRTSMNNLYYFNSSGNKAYYSGSYGLYLSSVSNIGIASGTTATPKLTCKRPPLMARGNTTYFSQTAFDNLDMYASYYDATYELWSVDAGTYETGWQKQESVHILNNGI